MRLIHTKVRDSPVAFATRPMPPRPRLRVPTAAHASTVASSRRVEGTSYVATITAMSYMDLSYADNLKCSNCFCLTPDDQAHLTKTKHCQSKVDRESKFPGLEIGARRNGIRLQDPFQPRQESLPIE